MKLNVLLSATSIIATARMQMQLAVTDSVMLEKPCAIDGKNMPWLLLVFMQSCQIVQSR